MSAHSIPREEKDTFDSENSLSFLQASLFASVLEDTITQLRILDECNNSLRVLRARSEMPALVAVKFGVAAGGDGRVSSSCAEDKLAKLAADRTLTLKTMVSCYKDLTTSRQYAALSKHVDEVLDLGEYRVRLEDDELKNRSTRRDFHKQIRQQRNHFKSVIYDTDATIEDLRTRVEDALLCAECRSRYTEKWQRARSEQHEQAICDRESGPLEAIDIYKLRADHEQRVHTEVELHMNIVINETLEKVEEWMNKYDKDMEEKDLQIHVKKNNYQNMHEKRIDLEAMIEKHSSLMKEWVQFKDEREKARQYREKMTASAVVVQAWWRGLLVRRQLGPYKPTKKKGKKK